MKSKSLLRSWKKSDYIIFFLIIPLILTSIFLLPTSIKQNLILNPLNPTLISIFFSNYTHTEAQHFLSNLLIYLIIIFLLFNIETNRKLFLKVALLNFILLPFLVSWFIVYFLPKLPPTQGFSAILCSFVGYILFSSYSWLKKNWYKKLDENFLMLLLMINFLIWSISENIILFSVITLITIFFLFLNRTQISKLIKQFEKERKKLLKEKFILRFYKMFVFAFTITFMFSLFALLPSNVIVGKIVINTPAHYFGYLFGILIPYILNKLEK